MILTVGQCYKQLKPHVYIHILTGHNMHSTVCVGVLHPIHTWTAVLLYYCLQMFGGQRRNSVRIKGLYMYGSVG